MKVTLNFVSTRLSDLLAHFHTLTSFLLLRDQVNPGWCHSELSREMEGAALRLIMKTFCRTTEVGSRTLVHAGLSGPETHGQYLSDCTVKPCAPLVEGKEGEEAQRRVWQELAAKLEAIAPGVTKTLDI